MLRKKWLWLVWFLVTGSYDVFSNDPHLSEKHKLSNEAKVNLWNQIAQDIIAEDAEKSLKYADSALALASANKKSSGYIIAKYNKGKYYAIIGDFKESLTHHTEALKLAEHIKDKTLQVRLNMDIGSAFGNLEEHEHAIEHFLRAESLLEKDQTMLRGGIFNNMGIVMTSQEKHREAIKYFKKCMNMEAWIEVSVNKAALLSNLGWANHQLGNYGESLQFLNEALALHQQKGSKINQAIVYTDIGASYMELGEFDLAFDALSQSQRICLAENYQLQLISVYKRYHELYERKGNYRHALAYYRKYSALKDSVFALDSKEQIFELRAKYEVERTKRENDLLTFQAEAKKEEIENIKIILFLSITAVILLVSVVVVLFINRRQRQRALTLTRLQKREIEEKAVALEIANERIEKINKNLENIVDQRTKKIISQQEALNSYAFSSNHRFRAPLANLLGIASLFRESKLTPGEMKALGDSVYSEAKKLDEVLAEINHQHTHEMDGSHTVNS